MSEDLQKNWNNLLQKLTTRVPKSTDEDPGIPRQTNNITISNGNSPEVKPSVIDLIANEREDFTNSNKSGKGQSSLSYNYVEDIPDLQINEVKNAKQDKKVGRTFALNSRFICYINENNVLVIRSLKNLSLTHTVHDFESKVLDLSFFEEGLTNNLAIICANGIVAAYSIDLNQAKDRILVKFVLKQNLDRTLERGLVEWKDPKKFGASIGDELVVFDILSQESLQEPTEEPPKPLSQSSTKFEATIRDFSFSPSYPLVYVLFENSTVRIINLENGQKVKEFTPHNVESSGPVLRVLAYKSLVRHEPLKTGEGEADKTYENAFRDVFLTVTHTFEVKVWDLSEWDAQNETYFCIETFQLNQFNDKLDPISLIQRFVFFDPNLSFLFIAFKTNGDKGLSINGLHIDRFYYGYSDMYETGKKSRKFFNSVQTVWFKKNDLTDLYVLNFGDDEIDSYFKKNSYMPETDFEPASTRTQEGSYGGSSKSILTFFVQNESNISIFEVWGEKLYPFSLVEDGLEKITQVEQLDGSEAPFPPEIPNFVKEFINENKKLQGRNPLSLVEEVDKITQAEQVDTQPSTVNKSDGSEALQSEVPNFVTDFINENTKHQGRKEAVAESDNSKSEAKSNLKKSETSGKDEVGEHLKNVLRDAPSKEETNSPDVPKSHTTHKKAKGGNEHKKDREGAAESHDHNKSKAPTKIVTRDNQKNAPVQSSALKSVEILEKELQNTKREEAQVQSIEKALEKRFQDLTDKISQSLNTKFLKIEEVVDNRINERVAKLQMNAVGDHLGKEVDEKLQREFATAFEKTVTPCFEKYLVKMFEQVCGSFEQGHKFYIDKLNIEQAKSAQLKETMNEVVKSFVQISNALTEGVVNNQTNYSRMELNMQDKQNQISRLIDQMSEIIQRQQDIQRKLEILEKDLHDTGYRYGNELTKF